MEYDGGTVTILYLQPWTASNGTAWPAEWTMSETGGGVGTRDIQSNQGRLLTSTTAGNVQRGILASAQWNQADGEATVDFTIASGTAAIPELILRGSGNWDTEIDSPVTGFKMIVIQSANVWAVYKRTGGTTTQIGTNQAFTPVVGTPYTMKFKLTGTSGAINVLGKVWNGSEPGYTTLSTVATGPNGPGQCQLANLSQAAAAQDVRFDNLSLDDLVTSIPPSRRPIFRRF